MIRKSLPKDFITEYEQRKNKLDSALEDIKKTLSLRIGQMNGRKGTRCRLSDSRVKQPAKLWRNSQAKGYSVEDAFKYVEDLLGVRIVCNNLSDMDLIVEMIKKDCHNLTYLETKNMVDSPAESGYRAVHVRVMYGGIFTPEEERIPCEIQIRTLAQDTWARLSRVDVYGRTVPPQISKLAQAFSKQISAIDGIAQLIREELTKTPKVADEIRDTDTITPQRLALLFKNKYGEDIFEWSLLDWMGNLKEAELSTIGEVRELLDDDKTRRTLNKLASGIRRYYLEDSEWAVLSSLVATEFSVLRGIKLAKQKLQSDWDEIVATARGEVLSEMPDTIDGFIQKLESGHVPFAALRELGGVEDCFRCGTEILRPDVAADAVLNYYGNPDIEVDLETLFMSTDIPECESVDFSGACHYCGYQMSKDD
jgi:ppGpp synthetase/RelA/SpoT-type nucleotidyltranferase